MRGGRRDQVPQAGRGLLRRFGELDDEGAGERVEERQGVPIEGGSGHRVSVCARRSSVPAQPRSARPTHAVKAGPQAEEAWSRGYAPSRGGHTSPRGGWARRMGGRASSRGGPASSRGGRRSPSGERAWRTGGPPSPSGGRGSSREGRTSPSGGPAWRTGGPPSPSGGRGSSRGGRTSPSGGRRIVHGRTCVLPRRTCVLPRRICILPRRTPLAERRTRLADRKTRRVTPRSHPTLYFFPSTHPQSTLNRSNVSHVVGCSPCIRLGYATGVAHTPSTPSAPSPPAK